MKERLFRFKRFSVRHVRSAMKVGVDGVLIGAWARCCGERLLDVGTGCGLIALMLAQRNEAALIDAIDIDNDSVEEAVANVLTSTWREHVHVEKKSFNELLTDSKTELYDSIVSNPPFFDSGIQSPQTARELSRHQGELSPYSLIEGSTGLLKPDGHLSFIAPSGMYESLIREGESVGLQVARTCFVRDRDSSQEKRVMLDFVKENQHVGTSASVEAKEEHLVMFGETGMPTERYRTLCGEFYLRF